MSYGWDITTPGYDSYVRIEQNVMIQIKKTIANGSIQYYGNAEFEEPGSYTYYNKPLAYQVKLKFKDTEQKAYDSSGKRYSAIVNGKATLFYEFDDQFGWTT